MGNTAKFHPHTGALIEPLWIRPDGRAMWPILGASPDDPPPEDPPADPPAPPADPAPTDPPADPGDDGKGGKAAILADLATERDKRQQLEAKVNELTTAQQSQMDAIAKALGLKTDEPPDADKLAAQVAEEQGRARDAQVQLAIYRTAATAEANADLLVDSSSFRVATKDVDPTDSAAMTAAIKAFLEQNPAFKAAPAAPVTPPFPGGPRPPAPSGAGTLGEAITNRLSRSNS
jgi:hypothetical protein